MLQEDKLIDAVQEVLQGSKKTVFMEMSIGNEERSFGTTTSYHISRYMNKIYPFNCLNYQYLKIYFEIIFLEFCDRI